MSPAEIPKTKYWGGSEVSQAGHDHHSHVQGCIDLIEVIKSLEEEQVSISFSATQHLNSAQRAEFDSLMTEVREYLASASSSASGTALHMLGKGHDPEVFAVFEKTLLDTAHRVSVPRKARLLQRSALVMLVIGFETLLSELARLAIRANPAVANLESSSLSLGQLQELASVSEARDYLIARHVEDLARGSIEDWAKWFDKFGVKLQAIPTDWLQFREVLARRNLIVHTAGKASTQYISTLASAGAKGEDLPQAGSLIEVTNDYLHASCQLIMATGTLLVASVWMKMEAKSPEAALEWSINMAERALEERNFDACVQIAAKMREAVGRHLDLVSDCRLKVVEWSARTMLGDDVAVQEEARKWDVRGIDPLYSHIRSVLILEDEDALVKIVGLAENGSLKKVTVLTSVVYERLRERLGSRIFDALKIKRPGVTLGAEGGEPSLEVAT